MNNNKNTIKYSNTNSIYKILIIRKFFIFILD